MCLSKIGYLGKGNGNLMLTKVNRVKRVKKMKNLNKKDQ